MNRAPLFEPDDLDGFDGLTACEGSPLDTGLEGTEGWFCPWEWDDLDGLDPEFPRETGFEGADGWVAGWEPDEFDAESPRETGLDGAAAWVC